MIRLSRIPFLTFAAILVIIVLPEAKASQPGLQIDAHELSNATDFELKSKFRAVAYSTGFTAIPIAAGFWMNQISLKLIGVIYGPATGIIYGGDISQTWSGVIIRGISSVGILIGYIGSLFDEVALSILLIGSAAFAGGSALRDTFYKAPNTVDRYNQQATVAGEFNVAPWIDSQNSAAGLSARIYF